MGHHTAASDASRARWFGSRSLHHRTHVRRTVHHVGRHALRAPNDPGGRHGTRPRLSALMSRNLRTCCVLRDYAGGTARNMCCKTQGVPNLDKEDEGPSKMYKEDGMSQFQLNIWVTRDFPRGFTHVIAGSFADP